MTWADRLQLTLKVAYPAAMAAAFIVAVSPLAVPSGGANDKVLHVLAFYGLTLMGAASYPRMPLFALLIMMSTFGAAIELVQGLAVVGRDRELDDWVVDTIATAAAVGPLCIAPWRDRCITNASRRSSS